MPATTRVVPSPAGSVMLGAGGGGGGGVDRPPGMPRGRMMEGEEAEEASRAVLAANHPGNTHCAQAYAALLQFAEAYRDATPDAQRRWPRGRPNRRRFMEGCLAKPEPMQQCMVPSYLRSHAEECEEITRSWHRDMDVPRGMEPGADQPEETEAERMEREMREIRESAFPVEVEEAERLREQGEAERAEQDEADPATFVDEDE
jgi:hypothetical protein